MLFTFWVSYFLLCYVGGTPTTWLDLMRIQSCSLEVNLLIFLTFSAKCTQALDCDFLFFLLILQHLTWWFDHLEHTVDLLLGAIAFVRFAWWNVSWLSWLGIWLLYIILKIFENFLRRFEVRNLQIKVAAIRLLSWNVLGGLGLDEFFGSGVEFDGCWVGHRLGVLVLAFS